MVKSKEIEQIAFDMGFHACGVSRAERLENHTERLFEWISNGYHGTMSYMERNTDLRLDPTMLVPDAKSVISVLLSYNTGELPVNLNPLKIARYACRTDYHTFMKQRLWRMLEVIRERFGPVSGRAFVDSAPVLEREWAVRAGLGWIGKNSMLINRALGSYVLIGELIVDIEIEQTPHSESNRCGTCSRCMEACPTGAIVSPGVIDARRCISYLTIEKKEPLTTNEAKMLSGWCFGCDVCQEVCPWNARSTRVDGAGQGTSGFHDFSTTQFANMTEVEFTARFGNTPLMRVGYERIAKIIKLSKKREA